MSWLIYFPFNSGDELDLEARVLWFSVEGKGTVTEISDHILDITFEIPGATILGVEIPKTSGAIRLEYAQDGPSNKGKIAINGSVIDDNNVTIHSNERKKRRNIDPSIDRDGEDVEFKIRNRRGKKSEITDISGLGLPSGTSVLITKA